MAFDNHVRRGHPIVFSLIIFFSIIELAISAWLTSRFDANHNYFSVDERDRTRFLLFASIWTVVFSALYMFFFFFLPSGIFSSVASHILFLSITWIFWTAGAASITAALGGGLNCTTQNIFVYCGQLNALEGFAWVIWILVTFAILVTIFRGITAARRGDGMRGPLIA
ncbi:hypothetical protein SERLA73DRAFT_189489 [Serpula lacrymans var. lacrymans S7.3]|uniref:MARVEL domain-containing protein n=2 Tax=Serpula lacrymans var. lacrymans TaxID=341189 RepID=F8QDR2_SERL3|nr:uncharacterized protein SERLADRAFT_480327 [Serpula lacrymans var. lacrymans S7.9]EGN93733.1 hypothetical protein SERLA73DRAFT_189489 [Serpula lacrymans var. lacrymans S7.3]EGO19102.1 hypothetical protein SERLADRAFT_480327 [Serpula lacrymans var. lacrymans S7.9]